MVENQAIGRVLRMGQGRSVKVIRFIVKGTIEEVRLNQNIFRSTLLKIVLGRKVTAVEKIGLCQDGLE